MLNLRYFSSMEIFAFESGWQIFQNVKKKNSYSAATIKRL